MPAIDARNSSLVSRFTRPIRAVPTNNFVGERGANVSGAAINDDARVNAVLDEFVVLGSDGEPVSPAPFKQQEEAPSNPDGGDGGVPAEAGFAIFLMQIGFGSPALGILFMILGVLVIGAVLIWAAVALSSRKSAKDMALLRDSGSSVPVGPSSTTTYVQALPPF